MKEITLQDMLKKQEQLEESTTEPKLLVRKLVNTAKEIHKAAKEGEVKIVTDYDADGICSAYIIRALVKEINENANVEVICNDRRNAYGVPQELKGDGKSRYIVLDMGSNELEHILSALGDNTIVVDHHIIEDKEANISFERDSTLLNPHAFPLSDGSFSDYCATGLAQRLFFYTKRIDSTFIPSEKTENTIKIMGAIGTIADCVNVIDTHSYNRKIIRDGMRCIDNADKTNIEETIGVFLSACGLNKCDVTSQTISGWEINRTKPDYEMLKKIANYFGVSIDYLLGNIPKKSDEEEIEILRQLLMKNGYMKPGEDLSKVEIKNIMKMLKSNKDFLKNCK